MCNSCRCKAKIAKKLIILVFVMGFVAILCGTLCCQRQQMLRLFAPLYFRANYTQKYIHENRDQDKMDIARPNEPSISI